MTCFRPRRPRSRALAGALLALTLAAAGCSDEGSSSDDGTGRADDRRAAVQTEAAALADELEAAITGRSATVVIDAVRGTPVTARGTASFDDTGPALDLELAFRGTPQRGSYVVDDGRARADAPRPSSVPEDGPVRPGNPWGPLFPDVDPTVVAAALREHARSVQAEAGGGDAVVHEVEVRGAPVLASMGFELTGVDRTAVPETLTYEIELEDGRLVSLRAGLQMFGTTTAAFSDWR